MVQDLRVRAITEPIVADAAVVVSELLGNAVRHGRPLPDGWLHVHWNLHPRMLHIQVTDGGQGPPSVASAPGLWATGGRGLMLIEALSCSWGVRPAAEGTCVWAEMSLAPRPSASGAEQRLR